MKQLLPIAYPLVIVEVGGKFMKASIKKEQGFYGSDICISI